MSNASVERLAVHNVGLVNHGDFFSLLLFRVEKRVLGDTHRCLFRNQFDTLHDAWHDGVFDTGIFTFGILANGDNVHSGVRRLIA